MTCYICSSKETTHFRKVDNHDLYKCRGCKVIFLNKINKSNDFFKDLSENSTMEYWSTPSFYKKHQDVFNHFFKKRLKSLSSIASRQGATPEKFLDIGSGFGFWPFYLQSSDINVTCLEPNKDAATYLTKELKLEDVENINLENYKTDEKFDVITICDVLEHLENPKEMLTKIANLMHEKSILYVQVPDAIGIRYPYKASLGLPQHLWQFNTRSLVYLLEEQGFEVIKKQKGVMGIIGQIDRSRFKSLHLSLAAIAEKLYLGNRLGITCKLK